MNPLGLADIRALAISILLYYFTGLPLARRLARGAGGPAFAWAMPCSLAVLMGGLFVARLCGLGLSESSWFVALAVLAAVLVPGWLEWRERRTGAAALRPDAPVVAEVSERVRSFEWWLIGGVALVLLLVGGPLGIVFDAFDHLTAIRRSLLSNAILPTDIFYRGGDGAGWDPRKGFLHPLHAFTCHIAHLDPLHLWRVLPAVLAPGVILAVSRFLRSWTGRGRRGDASLLVWLLVGSGSGILWVLRAGYPNHVAYPLSFFALAVAMDCLFPGAPGPLRESRAALAARPRLPVQLAGIALLAFAGALIHLVASLLLVAGLGFLGIALLLPRADRTGSGAPRDRKDRGRRLGLVAAAAFAGMVGPVVFRLLTQGRADSTLHTHPQGLLYLGGEWLLASPFFVLPEIGFAALLALIVLPLAVRAAPPGRRLALVLLVAGPWICVWTPLFTPLYHVFGYLAVRFLELLPVGAALVLALEQCVRMIRGVRGVRGAAGSPDAGRTLHGIRPAPLQLVWAGIVAALVLFTAGHAVYRWPAAYRAALVDARGEVTPEGAAGAFAYLGRVVEASPSHPPVVLADAFTSYIVGGMTGAHVVATLNQHGPPVDRRWRDRLDDQREMFLGTADKARIDSLLAAYQVDLVFVNSALSMPVREFGARFEQRSMEQARRRVETLPDEFPVFYRGPDGIVAGVRPGAGPVITPGSKAGADTIRGPEVPTPGTGRAGPFLGGAISAVDIVLPAQPLARGEIMQVPLAWLRTGAVATDLPILAHLRLRTAVPPRWFMNPHWSKPARLLAQAIDHRLYRFRVGFPPFSWDRDPARLTLGAPQPDTLRMIIPPRAAPGVYEVTLALLPEPFIANVSLRDLVRDDDSFEGPVVGRVTIR